MKIINKSGMTLIIYINNEISIQLLQNDQYNCNFNQLSNLLIVPQIDSYIKKPKHNMSKTFLVVVSEYTVQSNDNAILTLETEKDSMMFGLNYIRVKARERTIWKTATYYLKNNTNLDFLYKERRSHDKKQEYSMDYVHTLFYSSITIPVAIALYLNHISSAFIIFIVMAIILLLFIFNRIFTFLNQGDNSRFSKQDKLTFYKKSENAYISEYYYNKDLNKTGIGSASYSQKS